MEKSSQILIWSLSSPPPPLPTVKKSKRKDDLVEGTQAKTTKWAKKCAVSVFQGNFGFL